MPIIESGITVPLIATVLIHLRNRSLIPKIPQAAKWSPPDPTEKLPETLVIPESSVQRRITVRNPDTGEELFSTIQEITGKRNQTRRLIITERSRKQPSHVTLLPSVFPDNEYPLGQSGATIEQTPAPPPFPRKPRTKS